MILFRGFSTTISEPEGAVSLKEKEMSYEFIKYEVSGNGVANVLLNRPEKLNALSLPLQKELYDLSLIHI